MEEQRALVTLGNTYLDQAETATTVDEVARILSLTKKFFLDSLKVCEALRGVIDNKEELEMRSGVYINLSLYFDKMNQMEEANKYFRNRS